MDSVVWLMSLVPGEPGESAACGARASMLRRMRACVGAGKCVYVRRSPGSGALLVRVAWVWRVGVHAGRGEDAALPPVRCRRGSDGTCEERPNYIEIVTNLTMIFSAVSLLSIGVSLSTCAGRLRQRTRGILWGEQECAHNPEALLTQCPQLCGVQNIAFAHFWPTIKF